MSPECALLYICSYAFCLFSNPDALRSEKYTLHKMAIEHGLYGDNVTGVIDADQEKGSITLVTDARSKDEDEQQ